MVDNCYIKCQVCKTVTRIRLQAGWLPFHPIVVTCGECGISLSGSVEIDSELPKINFYFENADIVQDEAATYMVECSGEFPVEKQKRVEDCFINPVTPSIRAMERMDADNYEMFCGTISTLLTTRTYWNLYKRIFDLSKDLNSKYLLQEIRGIFDERLMPCRNSLEILRAVHLLEIRSFISPLRKDLLDDLKFSSDILKLDCKQQRYLLDFMNSHCGYRLTELQDSCYKLLDEFMDVFPKLIPAIAIQYYKAAKVDFVREGSTTSSFSDIKQFYLDCYETLGNLIIIPIALDNIKYRCDFNKLNEQSTENSLEAFFSMTKAKRYKLCSYNEVYTKKLGIIINSKLRNAIGHNDYEYDTKSQEITYIPNSKDRSKKKSIFLLQFESEAMYLIQGVLCTMEYLYRLRELDLMHSGVIPLPWNYREK